MPFLLEKKVEFEWNFRKTPFISKKLCHFHSISSSKPNGVKKEKKGTLGRRIRYSICKRLWVKKERTKEAA